MPEFRLNPYKHKDKPQTKQKFNNKSHEKPHETYGKCPCCRFEKKLDYHHWDYKNDVGCHLCRSCHEYIHDPNGARPSETPGNEWLSTALQRLIKRYDEYHSWVSASRICKQFTIPKRHEQEVRGYVAQVNDD